MAAGAHPRASENAAGRGIVRGVETLHVAEIESPVGSLRLASTAQGLAHVDLPHASGGGLAGWQRRFAPDARRLQAWEPNRVVAVQLVEFLEGKRNAFDLPLDLRGTPFQLRVWNALLEIPYSETRSYVEIATSVGRPSAVRAVGGANAANPIPFVVPCHRVIAADGRLGGYSGGLDLKARLLAMESGQPDDARLL